MEEEVPHEEQRVKVEQEHAPQEEMQIDGEQAAPAEGMEEDHGIGFLSPEEEHHLADAVSAAFLRGRSLVAHQIDSFDRFCEILPRLFEQTDDFTVAEDGYRVSVKIDNVRLQRPVVEDSHTDDEATVRDLMPWEARLRNLTYSAAMYADVSVKCHNSFVEKQDVGKKDKGKGLDVSRKSFKPKDVGSGVEEKFFENVKIGEIPCMVNSKLCRRSSKEAKNRDCEYDLGAYFIIRGSEKALISQEDRYLERIQVASKKDWKAYVGRPGKGLSTSQNIITLQLRQRVDEGPVIDIMIPGASPFPVIIALRALGLETDRSIFEALNCVSDSDLSDFLTSTFQEAEAEVVGEYSDDNYRDMETNIRYIGKKLLWDTGKTRSEAASDILQTRLLPHLNSAPSKAFYLGYMIHYFCDVYLNRRSHEESLKNRRVQCVNELFTGKLKQTMRRFYREISKRIKQCRAKNRQVDQKTVIDSTIITKDFQQAFRDGKWEAYRGNNYRTNRGNNKTVNPNPTVVTELQRKNPTQTMSNLRHVLAPATYTGKAVNARYPNKSHYGRFCPVETPDGDNCGYMKTMALFSWISSRNPEEEVLKYIMEFGTRPLDNVSPQELHTFRKVFMNGSWIGLSTAADELDENLRSVRRQGRIHPEVEIARNSQEEIHIFTDAGRVLRPVFFLQNGRVAITKRQEFELRRIKEEAAKIIFLLNSGIVELLGPEEEEKCVVASSVKQLNAASFAERNLYTHMELHPASVLSVAASLIPFLSHDQSIRTTHQAQKHGKQSIGHYSLAPKARADRTSYQLFYPQKAVVKTRTMQLLGKEELMNGQSCIVAVASHTGYNQEDSIILNQSSLDRGLFRSMLITTHKTVLDRKKTLESFGKPSVADINGFRHRDSVVEKLDSDGFPIVGTRLRASDVVIGKSTPTATGRYRDGSIVLKNFEAGTVEQVVLTENTEGCQIGLVQLGNARSPQVGDKFSSMHGQKGVVGACIQQEDLMFTQQGITPDAIINPHAFPTRQTLGQLMEAVAGKVAAVRCYRPKSTPFADSDPDEIANELHKCGFQKWGNERFYSGMYGTKIKAQIFVGITFYQQLTYMAEDRIKWRRIGRTHPLTRQPIRDRQRYGGIKFSEMERDCLVAHGASATLQERMFRLSDPHRVYVCIMCHRMANIGRSRLPLCKFCDKKGPSFVPVDIPYSCKLLIQELNSMCIDVRLMTESV